MRIRLCVSEGNIRGVGAVTRDRVGRVGMGDRVDPRDIALAQAGEESLSNNSRCRTMID
jgi:hypothetical protein